MSAHSQAHNAPELGSTTEPSSQDWNRFEDYCRSLRERHDVLTLVRQLNAMVSAVQLHRGMSMSLLAGNQLFKRELEELQQGLERRLIGLEVFAAQTGGLLSERDKGNLHSAWHTIRHDWHDDPLVDNFELHSHFIEELLGMIANLAEHLSRPLSSQFVETENSANDAVSYPQAFRQIEVLNFVARQMPHMVELVAKIRGLATHAATAGEVEYHQDRKLRYFVQCARAQNEKLRHQAERLDNLLEGRLQRLGDIKTYELKLLFLFNTVESDVLGGGVMATNGQHLFKLATEIIGVYSQVMNEAWNLLRQWLDEDMEKWISRI